MNAYMTNNMGSASSNDKTSSVRVSIFPSPNEKKKSLFQQNKFARGSVGKMINRELSLPRKL